jgi:hypothetical protein
MSNKFILEAQLQPQKLSNIQKKEYASKLNLPDNDQADLLFMSAILVSTGTNKNGATFLGSELIKARGTIALKPLDIEHEEDKIIGHICSSTYFDHDGNILDDEQLFASLASENAPKVSAAVDELDSMDMDVGIVAVVYKDRFKQIAEELELGKWKVSMECYYDEFDLKVGNSIIPKSAVHAHENTINQLQLQDAVRLTIAGKDSGTHKVSRVLRGIRFCGCGIVENPANPRSLVLEAAKDYTERVIDREGIDAGLQEAATLAVDAEDLIRKSPLSEDSTDNEVVQVGSAGYMIVENGTKLLEDSFNSNYNIVQQDAIRRASISRLHGDSSTYTVIGLNSKFICREKIELNESSEAVVYKTNEVGNISEIVTLTNSKEDAHLARRWGPADNSAGICVDFKKYQYEHPGLPNPGKIVATHWCKLFEEPCPVLGADAQDPTCLRSKYARRTPEKRVHDRQTVIEPYNPSADPEKTTLLEAVDQPTNPTLEEQIELNEPEGTPAPESMIVDDQSPPADTEIQEVKPSSTDPEGSIPEDPILPKKSVIEYDPLRDFPVQLASVTRANRNSLPPEAFGLPDKKIWPIHKPELCEGVMNIFPEVAKKMPSAARRRELFRNIMVAALKHGIDTTKFEEASVYRFKAGKDFDEDYGVPRLKLFPLNTRAQVIAAMSRISLIKVEISDEERDRLVVNILRAAKKFNINSDRFRKRALKVDD